MIEELQKRTGTILSDIDTLRERLVLKEYQDSLTELAGTAVEINGMITQAAGIPDESTRRDVFKKIETALQEVRDDIDLLIDLPDA